MTDYELNSCGCCAGVDGETPKHIDNPPGLDAVKYRVGVHAHFMESLQAKLSSAGLPYLAPLTTREENDFTIALCDALATTLDVLSFYQERIVNEHYLRTATERLSIQELARLIGYDLSPGVAASTWLAFTLQETPGSTSQAVEPVTLPVGIKVQSVPGQDEQAQTFETVEAVEARVEWNAIPAQTTIAWHPKLGDTSVWLDGVETGMQPGDALLIVGQERLDAAGSERWDIRLVTTVEENRTLARTRVGWDTGLGNTYPRVEPTGTGAKVYVFRQRAALFGHNAPDPRLMGTTGGSQLEFLVTGDEINRTWSNFSIQGSTLDLDAAYPKILPGSWVALVSNEKSNHSSGLEGYVELYQAQAVSFPSRRDYGLSGKVTRITPDTDEHLDRFRSRLRENLVLAQSELLAVAETPLGFPLYGASLSLSRLAPGITPGSALAVSGKRACIRLRSGKLDVTLTLDEGGSVKVTEGDILRLAGEPEEMVGSAWTLLAPTDFAARINQALTNPSSSRQLRLKVLDRDGKSGQLIVPASSIKQVPAGKDAQEVQEIVFIGALPDAVQADRDRSTFNLASALKNCYDRETVRVNANVAQATHGETVSEVLGSGDARVANTRCILRQSPLTYVSAATASGRSSTLKLSANDMLWTEVPNLYARGSSERVYMLRQDDAGNSSVLFGDGVEGARLPSGDHNIRALYRKGLGFDGNVMAGKLTTLLSRPLGVAGVINPEAATGGENSEPEEKARENAPLTVLTLDRAVSIRDYQDFARAYAGIAKAHALWLPNGPARGVFITVSGENGAPVLEGSKTYSNLQDALHRYGDPLVPIRIISYRKARFRLRMGIKVSIGGDAKVVLAEVDNRLRMAFGFDSREFGQGVSVDEIVAVAHGAAGLDAVQVRQFQRVDAAVIQLYRLLSSSQKFRFRSAMQPVGGFTRHHFRMKRQVVASRLSAALPRPSLTDVPQAAELLVLDENMLTLELMP